MSWFTYAWQIDNLCLLGVEIEGNRNLRGLGVVMLLEAIRRHPEVKQINFVARTRKGRELVDRLSDYGIISLQGKSYALRPLAGFFKRLFPSQEGAIINRKFLENFAPDCSSSPVGKNSATEAIIQRRSRFETPYQIFNSAFFWNYSSHLEYLREIMESIIKRRGAGVNRAIYLWSAGCGLGMEPAAIAITIVKLFSDQALDINDWNVRILATDKSLAVLKEARRGEYLAGEMIATKKRGLEEGLPDRYKPEDYFSLQRGIYRLKPAISRLIEFSRQDLGRSRFKPAAKNMDVIFCQWVFEYLEEDERYAVAKALAFSLKEGGFIFIGGMEEPVFRGLVEEGVLAPYHEDEAGGGYIYRASSALGAMVCTRGGSSLPGQLSFAGNLNAALMLAEVLGTLKNFQWKLSRSLLL
jgi:chemotaxis methyl-accepting protein methylase